MANPVTWFHISAQNPESLAKFYGEAFDWTITPGPGMSFVDTHKPGISGGIAGIMDGTDKSTIHIYAETNNIEAQLERVVKAGGRVAHGRQDLGGNMGWISGFIDPAGNYVGRWQRPPSAAKPAPKRRAAAKKATAKKAAPKKAAKKKAAPKKTAKKAAKKK